MAHDHRGIVIAVIFTLTTFFAGSCNTVASPVEIDQADRRSAENLGFWTAIITRVLIWQADLGGAKQLAVTLMLISVVKPLTHMYLELWRRK
ncbi:hypothetical protein OS190_03015 [Sulfitobacter sp. F26204]|uniref:hypothetical protein n=1 Tax=Sulfitobacter sp. F26204 TaxID=2996014 RepID=UPI00225E3A05|nr:hypothetical protein [Sulfitobacter sp. F26204]MCX7558522.1 hypothetical protein [Sulfitobacter sp. F26204]